MRPVLAFICRRASRTAHGRMAAGARSQTERLSPALRSRKFMRARVLLAFWRFDWFDYWGGCRRFIRDKNAASSWLADLCH
jgi:hypothetical protein